MPTFRKQDKTLTLSEFSGINYKSRVGKIYMGGEIYIALYDILKYIPTKKFNDYGIP